MISGLVVFFKVLGIDKGDKLCYNVAVRLRGARRKGQAMGKSIFETETCSRCGGSGHYSYNPMYGTTCFKCHGRGYVFTKRGLAASQFYTESLSVSTADLEVGMYVWDKFNGRWERVESHDDDKVVTNHCQYSGMRGYTWRRKARDDDELAEKRAAALAYQDTLTKAGKERKRRK